MKPLPIAIIGAGPVGLAAAAHILARGEQPLVLEAGSAVSHAIRQWAHVRMFTPWRFCIDRQAAALLAMRGWPPPLADEVPTGGELVARYLDPLAAALAPHVQVNARVTAVTRENADKVRTAGRNALPFVLRVASPDGSQRRIRARAVIDASGTWFSPNPAGADGLPALGEEEARALIASGIPDVLGVDRAIHAGRTTAVVGSGHSALNALIALATLREAVPGTRILWLMRKDNIAAAYGGEAADALPGRGDLGIQGRALVESAAVEVMAPFRIAAIERSAMGELTITGDHAGKPAQHAVDRMIVATGFRPDLAMLREMRLSLDPGLECAAALGPLIDPNIHSCGTVRPHGAAELAHPEAGFYIAGMKSYGRAPTFLLATGHEQVRSIAALLAGDMKAARRVELELPETGVCNTAPRAAVGAAACCAPAPPQAGCCAAKPALAIATLEDAQLDRAGADAS